MPEGQESISLSSRNVDGGGAAGEFNLVRYFSLTCLGVFVVLTTVMCTGFYYISKRYIRLDAEQRSVLVAKRLAPLAFVDRPAEGGMPGPGTPDYEVLDRQMRDVLKPLGIFRVRLYDATGRIVYATDSRVGTERPDSQNERLRKALAGHVVSELQAEMVAEVRLDPPKSPLDQGGQRGFVVETFVPIKGAGTPDEVQGVLELRQDVTPTYDRLPSIIALIVGASVLAMGTLYGILYLVVRNADHIIREQTHTIRKAKADIERYASELERRVEERTRQLRETLAQQRQDEKMVAMGTLAAGVAHELNTPLGTILGSAQLVLDHCSATVIRRRRTSGEGEESHLTAGCRQCLEDLGRIESQAKRCKEIIRNLVGFSRKSAGERSWENLGKLIERSVSLVEPEARHSGVRVDMVVGDDLPPMLVDGNEIQQVMVNIMNNGIAAMPEGGTLGVQLRRRDRTARIEIRDTGTGIEEAILPRIFEPFFTTKDVGKGTGLGLSISYRIVKDHGGNISVSSVVGEGSTFVIELPIDAAGTMGDQAQGNTMPVGADSPKDEEV